MAKPKEVKIYVENGSWIMRYWWKRQSYTLRPPTARLLTSIVNGVKAGPL